MHSKLVIRLLGVVCILLIVCYQYGFYTNPGLFNSYTITQSNESQIIKSSALFRGKSVNVDIFVQKQEIIQITMFRAGNFFTLVPLPNSLGQGYAVWHPNGFILPKDEREKIFIQTVINRAKEVHLHNIQKRDVRVLLLDFLGIQEELHSMPEEWIRR